MTFSYGQFHAFCDKEIADAPNAVWDGVENRLWDYAPGLMQAYGGTLSAHGWLDRRLIWELIDYGIPVRQMFTVSTYVYQEFAL